MRLPLAALAALLALCGLAAPAHAQDSGPINYGDNTSDYADNGECDDPRFEGNGMAEILTQTDLMRDAVDCEAGVEAGDLSFRPLPDYAGEGPAPTIDEIEFGDDESEYANNGACDDPRFGGRMMADVLISSDIRHDAADCRRGMELGELVFVSEDADSSLGDYGDEDYFDEGYGDEYEDEGSSPPGTNGGRVNLTGIDFGDNESPFALNSECDDRRFHGDAMASILIESDIGHDASDCALAVIDGRAEYRRAFDTSSQSLEGIEFGDDTSSYANNEECDDPRFAGEGVATILLEGDLRHDASDCRAAMVAGTIEYIGEPE